MSCAWPRCSLSGSAAPVWTSRPRGPPPTRSGSSSRCLGRRRSAPAARRRRCAGCWSGGRPRCRSGRPWASTPGKASSGSTATGSRRLLGWAVRLDAIETGARGRPCPRGAHGRRRGGRRLPPGSIDRAQGIDVDAGDDPQAGNADAPAEATEGLASRIGPWTAPDRAADQSNRIRLSSDVGGAPWEMTASRWSR